MKLYNLKCENTTNPLGISIRQPRFTWNLLSERRGVKQTSFIFTIKKEVYQNGEAIKETIFTTGKVESHETAYILQNVMLESRTRYYWNVEVADNYNETAEASEDSWFEMGLLNKEDWSAKWIEPERPAAYRFRIEPDSGFHDVQLFDNGTRRWVPDESKSVPAEEDPAQPHEIEEDTLFPCPMLRKEFEVRDGITRARIYATAHGIYSMELNGKKVGDYMFAPETSSYEKYLQVQTYDITDMLVSGENTIGVEISDGWWSGFIGCTGESVRYGDKLALLLQIEVEYADGRKEVITSDQSFVSTLNGPRRYADLAVGEKYDMNKILPGWSENGFDDSDWTPVQEKDFGYDNLKGQNAQHIRILGSYDIEEIYTSPKGELIVNNGQMMSGMLNMNISGEAGAVVTLRYFQHPDKDGNYYFETMGRNSQMTDTIILNKEGQAVYAPLFSFKGFQYVAVTADKGNIRLDNVKSLLVASDIDVTAEIITSNPKVNRLQKNIEWTLKSNMMSMLMDNADRERSGWTGDLQMIAPTTMYNLDAEAIYRRWLIYCNDDQGEHGEVPAIIPNWKCANALACDSTAGWGDVVILLPWEMYQKYGDKRILEENYDMMKKWLELEQYRAESFNPPFIGEVTPERAEYLQYIWNADWNFGDWMTPSALKNEETGEIRIGAQCLTWLLGTYYYAYGTEVMSKIAELLGKEEDAQKYRDLNEKIRKAAIKEFYESGQILESRFMGADILALHMGFYPEGEKEKLIDRLSELVEQKGMDAGFSSALVLPFLLCENGMTEKMYEFLLDERCPSWLFEVNDGATSVWESMYAHQPDGTIAMCSFMQPAYCSIGNWMMEGMGGISAAEPGFSKINIQPYFTKQLTEVEAGYDSVQGPIRCCWKQEENSKKLNAAIPANTTADVYLTGASMENVTESGEKLEEGKLPEGMIDIQNEEGGIRVTVGSGEYRFAW